jgi:hypothetical protein
MRPHKFTLGIVFIMACGTTTGPRAGDEFQLKVGESFMLDDAGARVVFRGVSSDSRCPSQVMCVWAGDAAVLIEVAPLHDVLQALSKVDTLHTNLDPKSLSLGSIELLLAQLDPYPETPGSIPADSYVATFKIQPLQ